MFNLNQEARGGTRNHWKGDLAIGNGSKLGVAIATTIKYAIDGIIYSKTGAATDIPLTAAAIQPVLTKCLYLICIDSAGTVTSIKGTAVLTADLTAGTKVLEWPQPTAGTCPIGAVKMTLASTATFTPGTTALDAANCTAAYYDLDTVPVAPLTS